MTALSPDDIYAKPANWVEAGAGAQGNLFLTGRAGTGKTTLLRRFLKEAGEKAIVLAPTGVAAVNAGGQTLHSFFKLPPRLIEPPDIRRLRSTRLIKAVETIIIDEISMVRSDMLDAIDRSLKLNRANKRPFGGARMILAGDLHQLPPVVRGAETEILRERYGGSYFFNAPAFKQAEFALLALKHIFRQEDPKFQALLGAMRQGRITPMDAETLNDCVSERSAIDASETHIVLTPNNANANKINIARLNELTTEERIYEADVQGQFEEKTFPTEAELELKIGARVMMLRNDPEGRWVNGTIGVVEGFDGDAVMVSIEGDVYSIEQASWEKYRYDLDKETKKVKREVVGTFKQVPLRGMFAHGQAYVAFSRARSLQGLEISRMPRPRDMVMDRAAFAFGKLDKVEDTSAYLRISTGEIRQR